MSGLPTWAGVVALVAAILVVQLGLWRLVIVPRLRARMAGAVREATIALGGEIVHSGTANFFGLESAGRTQIRGTGHLAVGRDEVVFVLLAPRRTVRIARERISTVDTPRSHLGKSVRRPLLRISYRDDAGADEVVAFDVGRDIRSWQEALGAG